MTSSPLSRLLENDPYLALLRAVLQSKTRFATERRHTTRPADAERVA